MIIQPADVVLQPTEVHRFGATAFDSLGKIILGATFEWASLPFVGSIDPSGRFQAGQVAGEYAAAVSVTATYRGRSHEATANVLITPGPVAEVSISPTAVQVFTGDSVSFSASATDRFGNRVTRGEVSWTAGAGSIDESGRFRAGRNPGREVVSALVDDGRAKAAGTAEVAVSQGFCETSRGTAAWVGEWTWLNPDGSRGPALGGFESETIFDLDWGTGPVVASHADRVLLRAEATIVVRRSGPVQFSIAGDDGFQLWLDGRKLLGDWTTGSYRRRSTTVQLGPGFYGLVLEYFENFGEARFAFRTDADVVEWDLAGECKGTYLAAPEQPLVVAGEGTPVELAARFGLEPDAIVTMGSTSSTALVMPPVEPIKLIVLQGIDSRGSCEDLARGMAAESLFSRASLITRAIQLDAWEKTGQVSTLRAEDVISFSYADEYSDCATGQSYGGSDYPVGGTAYAIYQPQDTCTGVQAAAEKLSRLADRFLRREPDVRFHFVGHSMGGVVAAYALAQSPPEIVREHVLSLVTLDSPLLQAPGISPASNCSGSSQAWDDLLGFSPVSEEVSYVTQVVPADRLLAINSSPIGQTLHGVAETRVACDQSEVPASLALGGLLLGCPWCALLFGVATAAELYGTGHSCVWVDPTALSTLAGFINLRTDVASTTRVAEDQVRVSSGDPSCAVNVAAVP